MGQTLAEVANPGTFRALKLGLGQLVSFDQTPRASCVTNLDV